MTDKSGEPVSEGLAGLCGYASEEEEEGEEEEDTGNK